ncbi:FecCD family ABC transporter permease [Cytobacillus purgationiresistens]|uniref:Probable heme-iron transport system permease protein IsdF n=1 Tax=Cytobacillus purgationiresistens TaxID=863449 RepID=A0ABU0AMN7_9BACI|nr:iron ABC transporter permease [Cytobacillus purgationiresistens]MDQ0272530.1 iron complex transport system permease protein [Cytobacillus purgationiresistens]
MNKKILYFLIVIVLLLAMAGYSAVTGSVSVSFKELIMDLLDGGNEKAAAIIDFRFPRIIVAMFAGAALSVAGVLFQAVMRNPLADAGVIGISAGASFFSLFGMLFLPGLYISGPFFAFIGGSVACLLVYWLSWKSGLNPLRIILTGIAVSAMFTGLREAMLMICSYFNVMVGASNASNLLMKTWNDVEVLTIYGLIGIILACISSSWCNVLSLQDKKAKNLGMNVSAARISISAIAVLLAAVATAVAGVIVFVGLLVPHIARQLIGSDHRILIPFSALAGALLILTADTLGRTLISPLEIPASTIMAVIGGPFLIFLLRKSDRVHGI